MMKNKLFSSLSIKLVLAAVALTTLTFTSCSKEDFDTKVIYNPAQVIITPQVMAIDMANGTVSDVTKDATFTWEGITASGNTATIAGTTDNPSISAATVTIKAAYKEKTGSVTIQTPALLTGIVTMNPTIFVIEKGPVNPECNCYNSFELRKQSDPMLGNKIYMTPTTHAYTHNGKQYIENPSEYFMTVTVKAPINKKRTLIGTPVILDLEHEAELKAIIDNLAKGMTYDNTEMKEYTFKSSAYSLFTAYVQPTVVTYTYAVVRICKDGTKTDVATFDMQDQSYHTVVPEEIGHPSHAGHYHAGHGHDAGHGHGHGSGNAGGGIINAD
ncbi:MAG: DUF3869 domain-containing protein [Phocaeicola sp.]|uniref:DUF3869 domain-containing protein n=1 Tax=Phocaeicola TaxID=909656 RepID=UPI00234E5D37|nr:DUF3869 domain-containing protein [Phocaeicola oris]MCE2615851.1 DUF3869 domain-containing protein [Phocaeicola oris]